MSPNRENLSPSEGPFKPLGEKALLTIVHGRLVGLRGLVRLAENNISKTVLCQEIPQHSVQKHTNVF